MNQQIKQQSEIYILDKNDAPKSNSVISWIFFFIRPYQKPLQTFFIYRLFRYTYFYMLPAAVGFYVDRLQNGDFQKSPRYYITIGLCFLFLYSLMLVNSWVFKKELILTENASRSLSLFGMSILHSLPIEWHANQATGRKLELVMDARRAVLEILRILRWQAMPIVGSLIGVLISLTFFNGPIYFLFLFASFAFFYLYLSWRLDLPLPKLYDQYKDSYSKLISKLYEFSSSVLTVKSLALESFIEDKAFALEKSAQIAKNSIYKIVFTRWIVINGIAAVFLSSICILAIKETYEKNISTGACASTIMLFYSLWVTLEGISVQQDQIHEYLTAIRRFIKLCKTPEEYIPKNQKIQLNSDWSNIKLRHVSFKYPDNPNPALKDISFEINKGQIVALVGPSGGGKSTLIKLVLGLYQPLSGEILVDDTDLKQIDPPSWLKNLAFVPQEIELFDGSIRDNILLNQPDVDQNKYKEVLIQSCLMDFVKSLPEGDETLVGERGLKLSGGQKQRVGVARVLLKQANFILLDEATSALDSITENQIQNSLFSNLKGKTLVIIAHRLSTVRTADKIVLLNDGKVDDIGTFSELMEKDGLFSEMWGIQGLIKKQ